MAENLRKVAGPAQRAFWPRGAPLNCLKFGKIFENQPIFGTKIGQNRRKAPLNVSGPAKKIFCEPALTYLPFLSLEEK